MEENQKNEVEEKEESLIETIKAAWKEASKFGKLRIITLTPLAFALIAYVFFILLFLLISLFLSCFPPSSSQKSFHMYFSSVEFFDEEDATITVIEQGFFDRYRVQTFSLSYEDANKNKELDYDELSSARIGKRVECYETAGTYENEELTIMLTPLKEMEKEATGTRGRGVFRMWFGLKSLVDYYDGGDKIKWKKFDFAHGYKTA